jgi:LysR family nitrogen assimilation transcriptional regulator
VRKLIDNAATRQNVKLRLAFEVNSPAAIKTMVLREGASTIVPYGAVADEIRAGRLQGRRIVRPEIVRKLYLVRPAGGRVFQHEALIEAFMQRMIAKLATAVGELLRPGKAGMPASAVAARA